MQEERDGESAGADSPARRNSKTENTQVMRRVDLEGAGKVLASAPPPTMVEAVSPASIAPAEFPVQPVIPATSPAGPLMVMPDVPWRVRFWRWIVRLFGADVS